MWLQERMTDNCSKCSSVEVSLCGLAVGPVPTVSNLRYGYCATTKYKCSLGEEFELLGVSLLVFKARTRFIHSVDMLLNVVCAFDRRLLVCLTDGSVMRFKHLSGDELGTCGTATKWIKQGTRHLFCGLLPPVPPIIHVQETVQIWSPAKNVFHSYYKSRSIYIIKCNAFCGQHASAGVSIQVARDPNGLQYILTGQHSRPFVFRYISSDQCCNVYWPHSVTTRLCYKV